MTFWLATAALTALLLVVVVVDVRTMRIPDPLNLAVGAAGLGANAALGRDLMGPLVGIAAGFLAIWAVNALYRRRAGRDGIGMGDAKFLGAAGAWVGWTGLPFVALSASLLGLGYAVVRGLRPGARMPFGPFLAVGLFATWLALRAA